ncbi:MAG: CHAT domain-containing protein [Polyangiaceae bacterium]|nr:CHAT domain-containing protein [Polyangiaceae bacterium]
MEARVSKSSPETVAVLHARRAAGEAISYKLTLGGESAEHHGETLAALARPREEAGAAAATPGELAAADASGGHEPGAAGARPIPDTPPDLLAAPPLPAQLARRLRQWALRGGKELTLCVLPEDDTLAALRWEARPGSLGIHRAVARRAGGGGGSTASTPSRGAPIRTEASPAARAEPRPRAAAALIVAWPRRDGRPLPGLERELSDLKSRLEAAQLEVTALADPRAGEIQAACAREAPVLVHFAHPGLEPAAPGEGARLPLPDEQGAPVWLHPDAVAQLLSGRPPSLVVLSIPCAGLALARELTAELGAITVSWPGPVPDALAADFALFFYQRLIDGQSALEAVESFRRRSAAEPGGPCAQMPVVWLPSPEAVGQPPLWTRPGDPPIFRGGARGGRADEVYRSGDELGGRPRVDGGARPLDSHGREPRARLEFEPLAAVNPALLLNGRPAIDRLSVDATAPIEGARLRIECDTGTGASVYRTTLDLARGPQPIPVDQICFPVLYDLSRQGSERRYINLSVRLSAGGALLAEATRSLLWMGPGEWMDRPDTWAFIPSFVKPNSEAVRSILDVAIQGLRKARIPSDVFSGYQRGTTEAVSLQMRMFYNTLQDSPFELKYINPPSGPVYEPGSRSRAGQQVRFPDEIVKHKRGTCHDLALLFAACAEHVGIHPVVILIPGHTFIAFWTSAGDHDRFWSQRERLRSTTAESRWVIDSAQDLATLVQGGALVALEATAVTNRETTYEAACAEGARRVEALRRTCRLDAAIDVAASRHAVQAM